MSTQPQEFTQVQRATAPEPARSDAERRLLAIWKDLLHRDDIGVNQGFFDLGGYSLLVSQLILRVNREFEKRISVADVFRAQTIERLAKLVVDSDHASHAAGIVPIQPAGGALPIYCVRGRAFFLNLARKLGKGQPFFGLELPDTDVRNLPQPHQFEDIAAALIRVLRQEQPRGPYQLCGYCVNGALAYEIACQLERAGEQVPLLMLLDTQNPANYWDYKANRLQHLTQKVVFHVSKLLRPGQRGLSGYMQQRVENVRSRADRLSRRLYSHSDSFDLQLLTLASWRYKPQPFGGRIVLFQSTERPKGDYWNYELGWKEIAKGGLDVIRLAGDHLGLFEEPNVTEIAKRVRQVTGHVQA